MSSACLPLPPATLTEMSDLCNVSLTTAVVTVVLPELSQSMPMMLLKAWKKTGWANLSTIPSGP